MPSFVCLNFSHRMVTYAIVKTRQVTVAVINLIWRFMELHIHKATCLFLFAVAISQVSAAYWILMALLLVVVPLPYLNPLTYPLLTLYLGVVTTIKMIYQLPIIERSDFDIDNCTGVMVRITVTALIIRHVKIN